MGHKSKESQSWEVKYKLMLSQKRSFVRIKTHTQVLVKPINQIFLLHNLLLWLFLRPTILGALGRTNVLWSSGISLNLRKSNKLHHDKHKSRVNIRLVKCNLIITYIKLFPYPSLWCSLFNCTVSKWNNRLEIEKELMTYHCSNFLHSHVSSRGFENSRSYSLRI